MPHSFNSTGPLHKHNWTDWSQPWPSRGAVQVLTYSQRNIQQIGTGCLCHSLRQGSQAVNCTEITETRFKLTSCKQYIVCKENNNKLFYIFYTYLHIYQIGRYTKSYVQLLCTCIIIYYTLMKFNEVQDYILWNQTATIYDNNFLLRIDYVMEKFSVRIHSLWSVWNEWNYYWWKSNDIFRKAVYWSKRSLSPQLSIFVSSVKKKVSHELLKAQYYS